MDAAFPISVTALTTLVLSVLAVLLRKGLRSRCLIPGVGELDLRVSAPGPGTPPAVPPQVVIVPASDKTDSA